MKKDLEIKSRYWSNHEQQRPNQIVHEIILLQKKMVIDKKAVEA